MADNNSAQIRFWAEGPGSQWANYQVELDACFSTINRSLIEGSGVSPGMRVLDIGSGSGATSIALSDALEHKVDITAVDVSPPLIAVARQRAAARGMTNIEFVEADAQRHPFPADRFDRLISRFGVMFFTDPVAAFTNMARTIKPGGEIHFVAWAGALHNPWFRIPLDIAISRLGEPDAVAANLPGPLAFADTDYLDDVLTAAGLKDFAITEETMPLTPPLPLDKAVELACKLGPAFRLQKEKNSAAEDLAWIQSEVTKAFEPYVKDDVMSIPARVVFVSAGI
ncbi:MAG: SAM-dependent methyltransferase [Gammaproteobacteria bacterium]|jgi:SAM-dependent methyltransferase